jgi:Tfp pilus assembly protein PilO
VGDLKDKIEKIPFTLLLFAYLGYLAIDWYLWSSTSDGALQQRIGQVVALKNEVNGLNTKVKQGEEFYRTLEKKKAQIRELAHTLDEKKAVLSEDLDVAAFMKTVFVEAHKSGVGVLKLDPKETKAYEYYEEKKFELTFHAVFVQLIVFLDRMANTQRIVRVENFQMKPVSNTNAKFVELEGVIELKTYRYAVSKADEIGSGKKDSTKPVAPGTAPAGQPGIVSPPSQSPSTAAPVPPPSGANQQPGRALPGGAE